MTGGGTGGHAYPAIAIADAIRQLSPNAVIQFAGSPNKIEFRIVPEAGYPIHPITVQGLERKLTARNLALPLKVAQGLREASALIREFDADVVVGTGGFVALPVLLAARYLVRPVVIQEQNAFMGLTNRVASLFAESIHLAFEEARLKGRKATIHLSGNPVRAELANAKKPEALDHFNLGHTKQVVLIVGGSGGSLALNEVVSKEIGRLLNTDGLGIIWQTGERYFDRFEASLPKHPRLTMLKYIDRMDLALASADLVVCRSGASTCAELMLTGTPSLMVPSPNVAEDHQTKNAESIAKKGASEVLKEASLSSEFLPRVQSLLANSAKLESMRAAARTLAKPKAAKMIAQDVLNIAENFRR